VSAPNWIIEILSLGNKKKKMKEKPSMYGKNEEKKY